MDREQSELNTVIRENELRHVQLRGAYSDLIQRRAKAESLMSDGSMNVAVSRTHTESAHIRQQIWYIIAVLTLVLFSRFALQYGKNATNPTSTIILTTIVVLFSTVNANGNAYSYTWTSMLLPMLISLIVILYIGLYIIHR
jgi:hypothetical protein